MTINMIGAYLTIKAGGLSSRQELSCLSSLVLIDIPWVDLCLQIVGLQLIRTIKNNQATDTTRLLKTVMRCKATQKQRELRLTTNHSHHTGMTNQKKGLIHSNPRTLRIFTNLTKNITAGLAEIEVIHSLRLVMSTSSIRELRYRVKEVKQPWCSLILNHP